MTCRICGQATTEGTPALHHLERSMLDTGLCLGCWTAAIEMQLWLLRATGRGFWALQVQEAMKRLLASLNAPAGQEQWLMPDDDATFIVGADRGTIPGSEPFECAICGAVLWLAPSSQKTAAAGAKPICYNCYLKVDPTEIKSQGITIEAIREFLDWRRRQP